ncbi:MAG: Rieske 2Fe-2S domain-containing protein [Gemmatimonadaceae bacterium]|nr:Rieske 2Fe-2S domain-containing protein [Gemmatimonadaceae bacterium]
MMLDEPTPLDRRNFVSHATLATVTALLAACGGGGGGNAPTSPTGNTGNPPSGGGGGGGGGGSSSLVVTLSNFPALNQVGGIALPGSVSGKPVALVRTNAGLIALSRICTHAACTVDINSTNNGFLCPCHASTYSVQGTNTGGPAPSPLERLTLTTSQDGTQVTIT